VLNKGDCPELPGGIASGKPMLFNLCCVESNLKTNTSLADELSVDDSFEQALKQKRDAERIQRVENRFMMDAGSIGNILKRPKKGLIVQARLKASS